MYLLYELESTVQEGNIIKWFNDIGKSSSHVTGDNVISFVQWTMTTNEHCNLALRNQHFIFGVLAATFTFYIYKKGIPVHQFLVICKQFNR